MKTPHALFLFLPLLFFFVSCERDIEIDLPNDQNLVVIEGRIEAGQAPVVTISRNRGFFETYPANLDDFIKQFIIQDATVSISDGTKTIPLHFVIDPFNFPYVYYTSTEMTGELGKRYELQVLADGQSLSASTVIPPAVALDSVFFKLDIFNAKEDSLGLVFIRFTDPDTLGNAYRMYSKRNSEKEYFPVDATSASDEYFNGLTIEYFNGQSRKPFGKDTFDKKAIYYTLGDTAYLKFCTMGWKESLFFQTYEIARNTNSNPFASPMIIQSNIKGGLGVWFGTSATYDTLIIKK